MLAKSYLFLSRSSTIVLPGGNMEDPMEPSAEPRLTAIELVFSNGRTFTIDIDADRLDGPGALYADCLEASTQDRRVRYTFQIAFKKPRQAPP
jgi:hypothetical protein